METLTLSRKERKRLTVMVGVTERELTLVQAGELMAVDYCQSKRIWKRYQLDWQHEALSLVRRKVIGRTLRNGRVQLGYRDQPLKWRALPAGAVRKLRPLKQPAKAKTKQTPSASHPWRCWQKIRFPATRPGSSALNSTIIISPMPPHAARPARGGSANSSANTCRRFRFLNKMASRHS